MHSKTRHVFAADQLCLFSAQVNCQGVEFYAHLWSVKIWCGGECKLYLTARGLEGLVEIWKRENSSLRMVFDEQAFYAGGVQDVLSYDQILIAMMRHVFQP